MLQQIAAQQAKRRRVAQPKNGGFGRPFIGLQAKGFYRTSATRSEKKTAFSWLST